MPSGIRGSPSASTSVGDSSRPSYTTSGRRNSAVEEPKAESFGGCPVVATFVLPNPTECGRPPRSRLLPVFHCLERLLLLASLPLRDTNLIYTRGGTSLRGVVENGAARMEQRETSMKARHFVVGLQGLGRGTAPRIREGNIPLRGTSP